MKVFEGYMYMEKYFEKFKFVCKVACVEEYAEKLCDIIKIKMNYNYKICFVNRRF